MAEFDAYSPEETIRKNLAESSDRHRMIAEQELAHLRELATEIVRGASPTAEFFASLPELRLQEEAAPTDTLPENTDPIASRMRADGAWRTLCLCREIRRQMGANAPTAESFFSDTEEIPSDAANRIVYRRNRYADDAYLRFASLLSSPRAAYADTFDAVCEEVYDHTCEYCILPIESSEEGDLQSFRRLIDRYGLKIAATCDVSAGEHGQLTRFALLRAHPIALPLPRRAQRYLECAIPSETLPVSEALYAAECCGLETVRIRSAVSYADRKPHTELVFAVGDEDPVAFWLYLSMEAPEYAPIGFYPHLPHQ